MRNGNSWHVRLCHGVQQLMALLFKDRTLQRLVTEHGHVLHSACRQQMMALLLGSVVAAIGKRVNSNRNVPVTNSRGVRYFVSVCSVCGAQQTIAATNADGRPSMLL